MPAPGQIAHGTDSWSEPAGGGAVVAAQLLALNGACTFHTALGDDDLGRRSVERLTELGLDLHVQWFGKTRRALVHVDRDRERTITTVGAKLLPAGPLPLDGYDGVFFVSGDVAALRSARAARYLAATPRELVTLGAAACRSTSWSAAGPTPASGTTAASTLRSSLPPRDRAVGRRTASGTSRPCLPARSRMPTARATPSPRQSSSASRAATRCGRRSISRRGRVPRSSRERGRTRHRSPVAVLQTGVDKWVRVG